MKNQEKSHNQMNGYNLTRNWFNYKFENQGKLKPLDAELYFYIVDKWNRYGHIKEIGLPTDFTMQALEIGSYKTYKKSLDRLIEHKFIVEIQKSKNIHVSRKIALVKNTNQNTKVLDKAYINEQTNLNANEGTEENSLINKPINHKKENNKTTNNTLLSEIDISDLELNEVEYFEIAKAFQELFIKNLKEAKAPTLHQEKAKFKSYVDPIRLMIEKDGVTKDQLTTVWKYLSSSEGEFWKSNILSTKKLREKFSQLSIKANTNGKTSSNKTKYTVSDNLKQKIAAKLQEGASPEFRAKTAERLGMIEQVFGKNR